MMGISRSMSVAPLVEPVTLDEVKAHLRLDTDEDDALISALAVAARQLVEQLTSRALINQTWQTVVDVWPGGCGLDLLPLPVASVSGIATLAADGTSTAVAADSYYTTAGAMPRIIAPSGIVSGRAAGGIIVTHVAGYGASGASVPAALKLAILQIAAKFYEQRGDDVGDAQADTITQIPSGARALINPFRVLRV